MSNDSGVTDQASGQKLSASTGSHQPQNAVDSALTPASQAASQGLTGQERRELVLYAVADAFAGAERLTEGARDLLRAVCENLGADYGGLWLANPQSRQLQCEVTWHTGLPELEEIATISRSMALPDRVSLPAAVWASGNAEWIEANDEPFKRIPLAVRADLHHACFVPVRQGDEVLGVLEFLWRQTTRPDDTARHMIGAIAPQLGKFIKRTRALRSALARTQELYETSRRIGMSRTMTEILEVLHTNPYLAHSSRASISVFDRPWNDDARPPESMEIVAAWNAAGDLPSMMGQRYIPEIEWLKTHHVREGSGYIADVNTDTHMTSTAREHLRALGTQSYAIFPLYANADWYGLLTIHFTQPRMIAAENTRHIQGLVDQASVAIRNLWLLEAEAKARKEAEQANALRLQFLAMISHELRTPLTSIKGFITTLLADDVTWDTASQRDFLETANEETDRLRNLIEQLLDLSQLEAHIMRIHPHEHPLLEMVSNILQRLKAATINHQLVLNIGRSLPPVMADRRRIEQVLINLIDNAAKYSPPGTTITLSAHREGEFVQVDVSDHGPGISAEERAYVFDAFRRGREENTKRVRGAGLGLSICRGIVEAHHGHIWINDDDGLGTTISFTLPATG